MRSLFLLLLSCGKMSGGAMKGLGLGEKEMMPGSGGMGGRSMAELGYMVDGKGPVDNKGGDWKISEELWGMIEERMSNERRKKGRLSFDKFSADIGAGKGGEKRRYDKVCHHVNTDCLSGMS
jgi:DNA polymerase zeta